VGRFAPTPSGDLHLGSLYAAVASYLDARSHGGRWILRIDDLDRPREVAGSASGILRTLERFGFEWDGEIARQSDRTEHYLSALRSMDARNLTFACSCSRLQLQDEPRYPGTCRNRAAAAKTPTATRLKIEPGQVAVEDRIQGLFVQDVAAAVGDIVVKRRDQLIAYVLAVVVDDAAQGITHIVRGADLLDNTPRQIYLQRVLGFERPSYAHVPVLVEADGSKLAKSRRSVQLSAESPLPQLLSAFTMLGLAPADPLRTATLAEAWAWAIGQWDIGNVPKCLSLRASC
jgi:glutamyl-Q tRNA(Asp) synthetase